MSERRYEAGMTVALHEGSFLKIQRVYIRQYHADNRREHMLVGPLFRRTKYLKALSKKVNEVAIVHESIHVPVQDVIGVRELIITNRPFPECRKGDEHTGRLVCRWVYNLDERAKGREYKKQRYIRRITEAEADPEYRVEDRVLRRRWFQEGYIGDEISYKEHGNGDIVDIRSESPLQVLDGWGGDLVDLENGEETSIPGPCRSASSYGRLMKPPLAQAADSNTSRKYTFGDTFCGGGGVSLGARQAGLEVKWAFDMNPNAGANYRRNFPNTDFFLAEAEQFIQLSVGISQHVDILHLSPPCQTFSRAHTIAGKNDENNEASFFAVVNLIKAVRPRLFTVEETDGIMDRQSRQFIDTALMGITELGYSFRICVLNAIEYGVCQNRKRLIIIGAAPGEELPPFPLPTHQDFFSKDPRRDLLPAVTLDDALSTITPESTDHHLNHVWQPAEWKTPYDAHRPFKNAIRAGGGEYDIYPDGRRKFTVRELACIQGFPDEYEFVGTLTDKRRIIGNAVPPPLSAAIMSTLRQWMTEKDFERME
ncbi:S-adenosyl-L-methionine-dependent methyltransferase [Ascobolus immersus RN42]|uniref:DNA (cytosine-5-)-methyltransferase n=2 Tax=Ascobolus immersus TaxID=5191 RepID=A0A3N4HN97_ASCIM|nr:Masc1 [Ascobolus immersus]RPA75302.1 S-adenosyl-L-methionine-dependent methyltransferase [Ascobolus immersus RN42]